MSTLNNPTTRADLGRSVSQSGEVMDTVDVTLMGWKSSLAILQKQQQINRRFNYCNESTSRQIMGLKKRISVAIARVKCRATHKN